MSSSSAAYVSIDAPPATFQYRQMNLPALPRIAEEPVDAAQVHLAAAALEAQLADAREQGVREGEQKARAECEARSTSEAAKIAAAIEVFQAMRKDYFARVEGEVVHLALAIAKKVLHREAQVDPTLVAALVQIALAQLKEGSAVSIRVRPEEAPRWRDHFATGAPGVAVVEDPALSPQDCLLETELGTANFSLDAQLKELEQGFFDVLAQKPRLG